MIRENVFYNEEDLIRYLGDRGYCARQILDTISHEKAHIDKATELGYEYLGYKVIEKNHDGELHTELAVSPIFKSLDSITMEHLKEIALAPDNPSSSDIETANGCLEFINFWNSLEEFFNIRK